MSFAKLKGAVAPSGPLKTARGKGGNYQILCKATRTKEVSGRKRSHRIEGQRRKGMEPHWGSRAGRRMKKMKSLA